jgi:predicted RNase H-like HicB family nuclease
MKFDCVLVREGKSYSALCLDLDVASQDASPAKAKRALKEAVELYLDGAIERSRPYLRPARTAEDPRTRHPETIVESFTLGVDLRIRVHA